MKTETQKLLATLYNAKMYIWVLESICEDYNDLWLGIPELVERSEYNQERIAELRLAVRRGLNQWLRESSSESIMEALVPMKRNRRYLAALLMLKQFARARFKHYFDSDHKGLPTAMARPVPFFPINRNQSDIVVPHSSPIVKIYGKTRMEIRGMILRSSDIKTLFALIQIMRQKELRIIDESFIYFQASLLEIAKTLTVRNPSAKSIQNAIWSSLERMRSCSITWVNESGERTLGGILSKARELSNSNVIEIYLDKTLIDMMEEGYATLVPEVFYGLPEKQAQLYYFLQSQMSWNQYGRYGRIDLFKFMEHTNLTGLKEKSRSRIRYEANEVLEEAKKLKVIKKYQIKNDQLELLAHEKEQDQEKESKSVRKAKQDKVPIRTSPGRLRIEVNTEYGQKYRDDGEI